MLKYIYLLIQELFDKYNYPSHVRHSLIPLPKQVSQLSSQQ